MKNPDRNTVSNLLDLPNVGKATAGDLQLLGINHPKQLIGKNPFEMHQKLSQLTNQRQDPCVIDVFMSVVYFMETGEALSWWSFTDKRKKILEENACVQ